MIDARISVGLPSHPKTKKLMRRCGAGGAWRLVCLFLWAAANKPDGDLTGMTVEDIELAADWDGDDGRFVAVMVEVGFLDEADGGYQIHDWNIHNPWAAGSEARSEKARWLATCKHHGREKAAELMPEYATRLLRSASSIQPVCGTLTDGMQECESSCAPLPSPSPLPSPRSSISEQTTSTTEPPSTENQPSSLSSSALDRCKTLADRLTKLETGRGLDFKIRDSNPNLREWVKSGITDPQLREAYDLALFQRQRDSDASPINPAFLHVFVQKVMKDEARPASPIAIKPWHESASGIEAKGKELGIDPPDPLTGGFTAFKARVFKAAGMIAEAA